MKKYLFLTSLLITQLFAFAQNYQLTFSGSGQSTELDSVLVQNISQNTQITINGDDILNLVGVLTNIVNPTSPPKCFNIYPNPMSESALIDFDINERSKIVISIYDISGKIVTSLSHNAEIGRQVFEISGLLAGAYTVRLSSNDWQSTASLISASSSNKPQIKYKGLNDYSANINFTKELLINTIQMQYNSGDLLVLTAYSGVHSCVKTIIPTSSQQIQMHLVNCVDPNDNSYATVTIGEQVWMAENLKYDNGCTEVSSVSDTDNGWCGFQLAGDSNAEDYGFYYQWSAALNICPNGWRLPSDEDWQSLEFSLGLGESESQLFDFRGTSQGSMLAGKADYWNSGNLTDDSQFYHSGFTALPGGHLLPSSGEVVFINSQNEGLFWSSTENGDLAIVRELNSQYSQISRKEVDKFYACNVRCIKDTIINDILPDVTSIDASSISYYSAKLGGVVDNEGSALVTERGIVFNTEGFPTVENNSGIRYLGYGIGSFSITINDLIPGTTYYFRAFARNQFGTSYGEVKLFQTNELTTPTVTTLSLTQTTATSAIVSSYCLDAGGSEVSSRGVVYSTQSEPTIDLNDGLVSQGEGLGQFDCHIQDLNLNSTYFVRSYATNEIGTSYGQQIEFFTSLDDQLPSVSTISANALYHFSAQVNSVVNNQGSSTVFERGVVVSTQDEPSIENNIGIFTNGAGIGAYSTVVTSLEQQTLYYVRAYAKNSIGTSYGEVMSFSTPDVLDALPCQDLPQFTDLRDTIQYNTVQIGTQCWMAENLRYMPFVSTTYEEQYNYPRYYVYEYSGNDLNTALLNANYIKFGVLYNKMAALNGQTPDNENDVELKGACPYGWHLPNDAEWTQLKDYLIANEFNYDNSSSGNKIAKSMASTTDWTISSVVGSVGNNLPTNNRSGFSALPGGQKSQYSSFTSKNLQASWWSSEDAPNTWGRMWYLYYNSSEFLYEQSLVNQGEALSVRCLRDDPKQIETAQISTKFVTAISQFTATSGGIIISDGNSEITGSGIVWSTTTMPTIEINEGISSNPYGVTDFSHTIENLSPHTIYFVRAYAENSQGIVYGNEKSFQTLSLPSAVEVETIEVSNVGIVSAKSGIRIIDDYNYPILTSGIVWSLNPNPTVDDYVGIVFEGNTIGEYESTITGLNPITNYYVRAFAQNISGVSYGEEFTFITKEGCADTLYDSRDSTVYNVVQMGNKCWMKENLKYLPQVFYASSYSATLPRYYVYDYIGESVMDAKSTANYSTYGVLYNWEAARFACPDGWHLSTHSDWVDLEINVCMSDSCEEAFSYDVMTGGMGEFEGSALIMDTTLWVSSTITNNQYVGTSGFDALPGGYKFQTNSFSYIGTTARFWLANNYNAASSYIRYVYNPYTTIIRSTANKEYGMSVRCVKD